MVFMAIDDVNRDVEAITQYCERFELVANPSICQAIIVGRAPTITEMTCHLFHPLFLMGLL